MEFVLDNGLICVALTTAGGSFTSIAANGREYLWQGDPAVMAFRTQFFVTRSRVAVVKGLSSGKPELAGLYSALGEPVRE